MWVGIFILPVVCQSEHFNINNFYTEEELYVWTCILSKGQQGVARLVSDKSSCIEAYEKNYCTSHSIYYLRR